VTIDPFAIDHAEGSFTLCPYCREIVEPYEAGAVYAVEVHEARTFGPTRELVEGLGGWFHAGHPPEAVGYARREPPPKPAG
jgi:hypothetical protein